MIDTGGHATMSTKVLNTSITSSQRHKMQIIDPNINEQSNQDLHMLDPTLTIKSGLQSTAYPPKEMDLVGGAELRREMEAVSQNFSRSPRDIQNGEQEVPIQWQVLSSNQ